MTSHKMKIGQGLINEILKFFIGDERWVRAWIATGRGDMMPADWTGLGHAVNVSFAWPHDGSVLPVNLYTTVAAVVSSRKAADFEGTRCFVCDDVGTKVKAEDLVDRFGYPHMVVRTSSLSHQWWFRTEEEFEGEEGRARYAQIISALAKLGLSDAGGNVVRYVRLPGSQNQKTKYGFPHPEVELVEFDEELDPVPPGDLDKLIQDAGLSSMSTASVDERFTADLGKTDTWIRALDALGWVKGQGTKRGVVDIVCPFQSDHTTGAETAGYLGGGRFKCHHGHCAEREGREFQDKICEALEEELVTGGLCSGREWLAREAFKDEPVGSDMIAEMARRAIRESAGPGVVFRDWDEAKERAVYVRGVGVFFDLWTGAVMDAKGFQVACRAFVRVGARGVNSADNLWFDPGSINGRVVDTMVYLPGWPKLCRVDGVVAVNRWTAPGLLEALPDKGSVSDSDVRVWLDHLEFLIEDAREREIWLDFFAHVLGKPGVKVNWCPVLVGGQGTGKDLLIEPVVQGLGRDNVAMPMPDELAGNFNEGYAAKQFVVFQELQTFDKITVYERMKTLISAPPHEIRINEKFQKTYVIPNRVCTMALSNHSDAMPLAQDDRRFWVCSSEATPKDADYYTELVRWYEEDGVGKVVRWLLDRGVVGKAGFLPGKCPQDFSGAKLDMAQSGASAGARWVIDQLEAGGLFAGRTLVTAKEILNGLTKFGQTPPAVRQSLTDKKVVEGLKLAGAQRVRGGKSLPVPGQGTVRLWMLNRSSELMEGLTEQGLVARWQRESAGQKVDESGL